MRRALVTGANGFVGSHLVQELVWHGWSVRALVRHGANRALLESLTSVSTHPQNTIDIDQNSCVINAGERGAVEYFEGDFADDASLRAAMHDCDAVFHVAGVTIESPGRSSFKWNTDAAVKLIKLAAETTPTPTFVFVSSLAAAGTSSREHPRTEIETPQPVSEYGRSKLAAEMALRRWASRVPISIVRPPMVLGPGDQMGLKMFQAIQISHIHFTSTFSRLYHAVVMVKDLVRALRLAAEKGKRLLPNPESDLDATTESSCENTEVHMNTGSNRLSATQTAQGIYHIATAEGVEYGTLGRLVAEAMGYHHIMVFRMPCEWTRIAVFFAENFGKIRKKSVYLNHDKCQEILAGSWNCSAQKARDELGFTPTETLENQLAQTATWYRQQHWIR